MNTGIAENSVVPVPCVKNEGEKISIHISDAKGKMQVELLIEANGNPKINFLNENGKVIYSLPEDEK